MPIGIDDIDDRFIDVDFEQDPNFTRGDNGGALYGNWGVFEEKYAVMSDSEIDEAIEKNMAEGLNGARLVTRIYDQGQEGSCVANACCQAHEIVQALQYGKENVIPLAAMHLYQRIGRSASSGASVSDGIDEMKERGVLPLDTPENRERFGDDVMKNTGFRQKVPANSAETASGIIYLEVDIIRTIQGLQTALVKQQPVVVGREGHSICYADLTNKGNQRIAPYPNSWNVRWGSPYADMEGGFGFDTVSQMKKSASWAATIRAVRAPQREAA